MGKLKRRLFKSLKVYLLGSNAPKPSKRVENLSLSAAFIIDPEVGSN
jgi:hypothetical protein